MTDEIKQIALRIKELREISGCTVEELARDLRIDPKTYLSYETDGFNIPISVLYHIAQKFRVDFTEILTGKTPRLDDFCVVKSGHGASIDRYPGYSFQSLAYKFMHKMMEPLLVTVDPEHDDPALVSHLGQEFNFVLEGSIEFIFDDKHVVLEKGDSVYFNPSHPHGQRAFGGKPARFLTVIAE
jgi:transcriptional regulator with XRE-family HTH domain